VPREQALFLLGTLLTWGIILAVRCYGLDALQVEVYGDITTVRDYVLAINAGQWPTHFAVGLGPLYRYAISPLVALVGSG
jgi:hypothetical protein